MTSGARLRILAGMSILLAVAVPRASACLWDHDTLAVERTQFPSVLELISGFVPIHSKEYYEWIAADRSASLEKDPQNAAALDDLAVAYDKLGRTAEAILLMRTKEERMPGLYTTAANLGTFLIHHGQFEEGLGHIRRAIRINPDAHFGREIIQQRLVEYMIEQRKPGGTLPLEPEAPEYVSDRGFGFAGFYLKTLPPEAWQRPPSARKEEILKARKGVLGMLRFGNNDSPILMEALGDLLLSEGHPVKDNPLNLAAMAYLRASQLVGDDENARKAYRLKAMNALNMQAMVVSSRMTGHDGAEKLPMVEQELGEWVGKAAGFRQELHEAERAWILEGKQPDEEFLRRLRRIKLVAE